MEIVIIIEHNERNENVIETINSMTERKILNAKQGVLGHILSEKKKPEETKNTCKIRVALIRQSLNCRNLKENRKIME